jgi:hypothetical protein
MLLKLQTIILFFLLSLLSLSAQEKVDFSVDDNLLSVNVYNLKANCCSGFVSDFHVNFASGLITITLTDTTIQKCRCDCNYDLNINIGPVSQGKYSVVVYRDDLVRFSYPKDKRTILGKKDVSVYDPHPKAPISLEFRQSACKSSTKYAVADETLKDNVEVFANPSSGAVSIKFNLKENSDAEIKIINFLGKELSSTKLSGLKIGTNLVHIDISDIPPGMYLGKIQTSRGQFINFKLMWSK